MKKVLVCCLMIAMLMSMSITALAAPGGFVSSPSGNSAPTVEEFDPADEDCTATLVITPYIDRHDLPDDLRDALENAYEEIANSDDLTELNADLAKLAADGNIDGSKLAVSDLFNIHATGCENHDEHIDFDITLDADTLDHFVALLQRNSNGEWELVKDAQVVNNGEHLKFSVDYFSPFAIVVDTTETTPNEPETGDDFSVYIYAAVMAVSALAIVVIAVKSKKQHA